MQELVLIRPGRKVDTELVIELDKAVLKREFEERLAECGTLAFRVARNVVNSASDAEDVAQDAMLQAYKHSTHCVPPQNRAHRRIGTPAAKGFAVLPGHDATAYLLASRFSG